MSLSTTPSGERIHISFFGKRNAGKSSLVNAVTGQNIAVVSNVLGTTTDPVKKAMELLPLGPVLITDTPGFDDEGYLGNLRVSKTNEILAKTDIAVLVTDATTPEDDEIKAFEKILIEKKLPYIKAHNKADLLDTVPKNDEKNIWVSAEKKINTEKLKEMLGKLSKKDGEDKKIVGDLLKKDDIVILVTPIDESAPKGRLILPQQQTIRDILDSHCINIVCRETELTKTLDSLKQNPKMVITDSQAFGVVSKLVPKDILLTSFSILFARYKGSLKNQVLGAATLSKLKENDIILISEGCTHHRQCNDIGTVKMPSWIENFCGKKFKYEFTSGGEFPKDLSPYSLIVHCGGCMLNEAEMKSRIAAAKNADIPITNYGVLIAYMNGILKRSLEPFEDIYNLI